MQTKRGLRHICTVAGLLVALLTGFGVLPLDAEGGRGTISGRVVDVSGAVLQGARVEILQRLSYVVSDGQGEFTFTDLVPGSYTVTVSYVGFAPFSTDVTVSIGQMARLDAVLKVASAREAVTVYGGRQSGEVAAINRERTSDNILQVLPVEVITSLPNTNIADALGRLPSVTLERDEGEGKYVQIRGTEPRFSNVTINGINVPAPESGVRQIKLDVMPANLVDSVEINKTLSANQDADAIGGSVNLVTKTAEERPTFYLNGIGGYTPIVGGRPLYEVDGTVGKRFGKSKRLGILIGGSWDWNGRGIDDVEPAVQASQCDASGCDGDQQAQANAPFYPTYQTEDLREYRYYRERYGLAGSVDYKLGDISGLYARFIYSHFNNFGDRWVYTPSIGSFTGAPANLGNPDGNMAFNTQIRRPVEVIGSLQMGGKQVLTNWLLLYDLSVSRSAQEDQKYSSADFGITDPNSPLNALTFAVDRSNPNTPKLVPQGAANIYDVSQYYLQDVDINRGYTAQLNVQGGVSAARNYHFGERFGTFEFGGKIRNAHKFEDANEQVFNVNDANSLNSDMQMTQFLGSFRNSDYYDKRYTFGPTTDFGKIRSFFNANPSSFTLDFNGTKANTDPNNYDLVERVSAGYVMNTMQIGRVRLQTGLRFEGTQEDILGNVVNFDSNGDYVSTAAQRKNSSYVDVLPSVQVHFGLGHDAAIRASYGRGISRPNYGDLPPFFNSDASANQVAVGNINLRPTRANNYDLLFEKYLQPLGLIQAGFFYKQLSNPIYSIKTTITDPAQFGPQYVGFELDQPVNGTNARLYGFELAYQQQLTFLPGVLKGLGISANYGYTNSATDSVLNRTDKPALQRQAPNTWNVSPTFDRHRVSARLGISHNDANIFQYNYFNVGADGSVSPVPLGLKGPNGDVYLYAHTQVDAQGSFRVYRGLQVIVSGLNLTNEVFGFYQGSPQYPIQREFYKPSYSFGLRYTLSNEPK